MFKKAIYFVLFLALLSACDLIPAEQAVPTEMVATTDPSTATPLPSQTPAIVIRPTSALATSTPTPIAAPTRRSPFPVQLSTPVVDIGFSTISFASASRLRELLRLEQQEFRQYTATADGQFVLASSSSGTYFYIRSANLTYSWPQISSFGLPCRSCLSLSADATRFAILTRAESDWQIQIYDIQNDSISLFKAISLEQKFTYQPNPATLALSPDGRTLAYSAKSQPVVILNLDSGEELFRYKTPADELAFAPDGQRLMMFAGREMLFWNTTTWKNPTNLLASRADQPWAFSPDGKLIALALPNRIQVYDLETLKITRQVILLAKDYREWHIRFRDNQILLGHAPAKDGGYTMAEWNIATGETQRLEDLPAPALNEMEAWLAFSLPSAPSAGNINLSQLKLLKFVSAESVLANGSNYACWLRLTTGENQCYTDPENPIHASDSLPFLERRGQFATTLETWQGLQILTTGTYQIAGVNRTGEFIVVNLNDEGTSLYQSEHKLPTLSFAGPLRDFAENLLYMVFSTQHQGKTSITLFDKKNFAEIKGLVQYQKTGDRIQKPVALSVDGGEVYFLELNLDTGFSSLQAVTVNGEVSTLAKLELPAEPEEMVVSQTGLFVIGLKDGSLFIYDSVTGNTQSLQFSQEPISRMSFSADGRFLAVASTLRFAVLGVVP